MAAFDEQSDTLPLRAAAKMVGYSTTQAYERAHEVDANGDAWLVEGHVRIIRIGGRYRVSKRQLAKLLDPIEAAS